MSAPCVPRMMRTNFCNHRCSKEMNLCWNWNRAGQEGEEAHLVRIGNAVVAAGEDDGDGGRDEGVGGPHDGGEARAEEALDQRVDPGHEQQRLHHPRLLLLRELSCQAPERRAPRTGHRRRTHIEERQ